VSTDVVGKYCYYLDMPLEDRRVPVIVDVALIGRTKIIKLHSAFWIQVRPMVHTDGASATPTYWTLLDCCMRNFCPCAEPGYNEDEL
jgi:hypothetical protein